MCTWFFHETGFIDACIDALCFFCSTFSSAMTAISQHGTMPHKYFFNAISYCHTLIELMSYHIPQVKRCHKSYMLMSYTDDLSRNVSATTHTTQQEQTQLLISLTANVCSMPHNTQDTAPLQYIASHSVPYPLKAVTRRHR